MHYTKNNIDPKIMREIFIEKKTPYRPIGNEILSLPIPHKKLVWHRNNQVHWTQTVAIVKHKRKKHRFDNFNYRLSFHYIYITLHYIILHYIILIILYYIILYYIILYCAMLYYLILYVALFLGKLGLTCHGSTQLIDDPKNGNFLGLIDLSKLKLFMRNEFLGEES